MTEVITGKTEQDKLDAAKALERDPLIEDAQAEIIAAHKEKEKNYADQSTFGDNDDGLGKVGLINNSVSETITGLTESTQEKEKKKKDDLHTLIMLLERIDELNKEISEIRAQIEKLNELDDAGDEILAAMKRGEDVLDENGEYKNKEFEAKVKEYERDHDVTLERKDPETVLRVQEGIAAERAALEERASEKEQDLDREIDKLEKEGYGIDEAREKIKNGGASSLDQEATETAFNYKLSSESDKELIDKVAKDDHVFAEKLEDVASLDLFSGGLGSDKPVDRQASASSSISETSIKAESIKVAYNSAASGEETNVTPGNEPVVKIENVPGVAIG